MAINRDFGLLLWNVFENRKRTFFSGRKTKRTEFDNLIMIRVFQIVFGQQVVTNTGTQQREDGSTMRYAKALPMNFRFLPGLHGARRTGASQPMQKQHGTKRETQHIRFTLGGLSLGVIFSSRWLCRSRSSTASYLPDGDYPPRPRRGKHCLWLRNKYLKFVDGLQKNIKISVLSPGCFIYMMVLPTELPRYKIDRLPSPGRIG